MLRRLVLLAGLLMLFLGAALLGLGFEAAAVWLLVAGGTVTAGILFERVIYKPVKDTSPGAGWMKTGESFVDTGTGKTIDVFYEPRSGERQYVARPERGQPG